MKKEDKMSNNNISTKLSIAEQIDLATVVIEKRRKDKNTPFYMDEMHLLRLKNNNSNNNVQTKHEDTIDREPER